MSLHCCLILNSEPQIFSDQFNALFKMNGLLFISEVDFYLISMHFSKTKQKPYSYIHTHVSETFFVLFELINHNCGVMILFCLCHPLNFYYLYCSSGSSSLRKDTFLH